MRTRALSMILVGVLLTGGGVALAGATGGSPDAASARPANSTTDASPAASVTTHGRAPSATGGASAVAVCPDATATDSHASGSATATHLGTRTTADGVTIRVYRLAGTLFGCGPVPAGAGSSTPLPSCDVGSVSIEMSDTTAVGQGDLGLPYASTLSNGSTTSPGAPLPDPSPTTPNAGTEPPSISTGTFGVVEGDPVWWLAMQVGADVATGQVTFSGGSTDETAPVGGVLVLAHHVSGSTASDPYSVEGTVQLLDATSNVLQTITLPQPAVTGPPPVPVPLPYPQPQAGGQGSAPGSSSSSGSSTGAQAKTGGANNSSAAASTASRPASSSPAAVIACPMLPATSVPPATLLPGGISKSS